MLFKPCDPNLELFLNGVKIECVTCVNFLGLMIDNKLKFGAHVNHIVSKLYSMLSIVRRNRVCLPSSSYVYIFNAFALPYLSYCVSAFFPFLRKQDVFKLQNAISKCCSLCLINSPKVQSLAQSRQTRLVSNVVRFKIPYSLFMSLEPSNHSYYTRKRGYCLIRPKRNLGAASFNFWAPRLLNEIPAS